jgi:hypothetical protein
MSKQTSLEPQLDVSGGLIATNSLGHPICRSRAELVRFWQWFDRSAVVDELGRPIPVYHGTNSSFDAFDAAMLTTILRTNRLGHFFTPDVRKAARYAGYKQGDRIIACYLSLPDPLEVDFVRLQRAVGSATAYRSLARDVGVRGAIVVRDGHHSEFIAPVSTQIKSVTNRGSWSSIDPRIDF